MTTKKEEEDQISYSKKLDLIIDKNKNKASALKKIMNAIEQEKNKSKSDSK